MTRHICRIVKGVKKLFNHSKELALFLEQMRFSRGISQEDFTDGIISNRQYQRYINGSSAMPYHLLDAFAERLNTKKEILLLEFDNYAIKEAEIVLDFYNAINNNELDSAKSIGENITPQFILDNYNLKLYEHAKSLMDYRENKITKSDYIIYNKKLIDYPKILSHAAMTMIETVILSSLLPYTDDEEQNKIFPKIQSFLSNPNLIWTGSQILTFNMIIYMIAKYSGVKKDFVNVIQFCKMAISTNLKARYFLNLDYYYYFLALSYYNLGNKDLFELNLYKCYTTLEMMDNLTKTSKILNLVKKDFNMDLSQFAIDYQLKKYKTKGLN